MKISTLLWPSPANSNTKCGNTKCGQNEFTKKFSNKKSRMTRYELRDCENTCATSPVTSHDPFASSVWTSLCLASPSFLLFGLCFHVATAKTCYSLIYNHCLCHVQTLLCESERPPSSATAYIRCREAIYVYQYSHLWQSADSM